jgi:hypothetical protein
MIVAMEPAGALRSASSFWPMIAPSSDAIDARPLSTRFSSVSGRAMTPTLEPCIP